MTVRSPEPSVSFARFADLFENSAWVAEEAARLHPALCTDDIEAIHSALCAVMRDASHERKLALVREHPELGAAKGAAVDGLGRASRGEQGSAGLDRCTEEQAIRLRDLNRRYRTRFGFPFVLAVAGRNYDEILAILEQRLTRSAEEEFETALAEIERIARFRLARLIDEGSTA